MSTMNEFESLKDYLRAEEAADDDLGFLPVPLVAEYLEISPAAVSSRLNRGTLGEIRIGKGRYVSTASLRQFDSDREEMVAKTEKFLIDLAKAGVSKVFYDPVMTNIGLSWRVPADRDKIGWVLGEVSKRCKKKEGMLSVLVHKKTNGETRPGQGFFDLAEWMEHDVSDPDTFVREQTRLVLKRFRN